MDEQSKTKSWVGSSLEEIYGKYGPWNYNVDPVTPSRYHHVLYNLKSVDLKNSPQPFGNFEKPMWDNDHVRMPFSENNLFPIKNDEGKEILTSRWEIIQTSLLQSINNSQELETAIRKYNTNLPKFTALHDFFEEEVGEEESDQFFKNILPGIINLALQLPHLIQQNIPLLKQGAPKSISLSQHQISSLLANAFLCTFPWRKDMALSYPRTNFTRLFSLANIPNRRDAIMNKFKCICHYFKRILAKCPVGVVTFERKSQSRHMFPRWDKQNINLGNTKVHICDKGKIEDAKGLLQVDFANKFVGGGVLGYGCVQEEIRYIICPELIVSRLFTERLSSTEALVITGAERYSNYTGYGDCFEWSGNYDDSTPFDEYGRKRINVVAIDATPFSKNNEQFSPSMMIRELNKAYIGFCSRFDKILPAVATGNWGCGAFGGNPYLKSLLQLISCSCAKRDLVYYTFGDTNLRDSIYEMYTFIATNQITADKLWRYLCGFAASKLSGDHLFAYIQQAHFDVRKQMCITDFVSEEPSTSSKWFKKEPLDETLKYSERKRISPQTEKNPSDEDDFYKDDDDVIESTPPDKQIPSKKITLDIRSVSEKERKTKQRSIDSHGILNFFEKLDGKVEVFDETSSMEVSDLNDKKLNEESNENEFDELMDLEEVVVIKNPESNFSSGKNSKPQKKITDFFKTSFNC